MGERIQESFDGIRDGCPKQEISSSLQEARIVIGHRQNIYERLWPHVSRGCRSPALVDCPDPGFGASCLAVPGRSHADRVSWVQVSSARPRHPGLYPSRGKVVTSGGPPQFACSRSTMAFCRSVGRTT